MAMSRIFTTSQIYPPSGSNFIMSHEDQLRHRLFNTLSNLGIDWMFYAIIRMKFQATLGMLGLK